MNQQQFLRQSIQNLAALLALVFARRFGIPLEVIKALIGYVVLCGASALVLTVGPLFQREGLGGVGGFFRGSSTWWRAVMLGGTVAALLLDIRFAIGLVGYMILGVVHDLFLSRVVLIDVIALGIEFSLKAALGGLALDVRISPWLLVCTFFLALLVALGKRRNEMGRNQEDGGLARAVLFEYSPKLLDQLLAVVTSAAFIAFAIYTVTAPGVTRARLYLTLPFVLYGILRYLYLVHRRDLEYGSEVALLTDGPSLVNMLIWLALTLYLLGPAT